jgi:hypothetical protein
MENKRKECSAVNQGKKSFENYVAFNGGSPAPILAQTPCYCSLSVSVATVWRIGLIRIGDESFAIVVFVENCPPVQPVERPRLVAGPAGKGQPGALSRASEWC